MKYTLLVYDGACCIARALVSGYTLAEAKRQMRWFFGSGVWFAAGSNRAAVLAPASEPFGGRGVAAKVGTALVGA